MNAIGIERTALVVLVFCGTVYGSQDSLGPNGINALGLGLTGNTVEIGQVESYRSARHNYDTAANANTTIQPLLVSRQNMTSLANQDIDGNDATGVETPDDNHSTWVAGVIISSNPTLTGVAPDANLLSAGFRSPNAGLGPHEDILTTVQHAATAFPVDPTTVRAINHSYAIFEQTGETRDGNSFLTLGMDWISTHHNLLNVIAGNQDFSPSWQPTDHFNGLTVAASAKKPRWRVPRSSRF